MHNLIFSPVGVLSQSFCDNTPGTRTFTVPAGVTKLAKVKCWGAGGAGADDSLATPGGGGGGGYSEIQSITVTPGQAISYTVGLGGTPTHGQNEAPSGGSSSVGAPVNISATGGAGGFANLTGGAGGTGSGGSVNNTGGSGGTSVNTAPFPPSGGGGAAGPDGNGITAQSSSSTGNVTPGGSGDNGLGGTGGTAGVAGQNAQVGAAGGDDTVRGGGGGGGGCSNGASIAAGGAGGNPGGGGGGGNNTAFGGSNIIGGTGGNGQICFLWGGSGRLPAQPPTANFYVAKTGSDNFPGTQAQPFLSITKGVNSAGPGQTVSVGDGTYTENISVTSAGSINNPVTVFAANGPGKVTITGTGAVPGSNWTGGAVIQPSNWAGDDSGDPTASGNQYITWQNFTVTTPTAIPNQVLAFRCPTGWTIDGCTIQNIGGGANVRGQNVTIKNSTFTNIEGTNAHYIVGAGGDGSSAPKLQGFQQNNNTVSAINTQNLTNAGNSAVHKLLGSTGAVIKGNTISNVKGTGIWFDGAGPPNDTMTISHNTLHDCRDYGIQLEDNQNANFSIDRCTIYNCGNTGASGQTGGIGLNETSVGTITSCAFVGPGGVASGNIQDISIRNGSHGSDHTTNITIGGNGKGNYFNGNGFPCIMDDNDPTYSTPQGGSIAFDYDFYGPNVNQYTEFGGHTSTTLADVQGFFGQEAHGSNVSSQPPNTGA